jgi:PAS domain S-box-containing protein
MSVEYLAARAARTILTLDPSVAVRQSDAPGEVDVTEPSHASSHNDAEKALRARVRHDRLLLDVALDAIVDMNDSGTITDWNAQAVALFGWSHDEAVGRPLHETIVPPSLRSAHRRGLERFLSTGETSILNKRIEITALHRDGRELPVELAIAVLRGDDGCSFRAFIRDLSERRKAEDERRRLEARMQQTQKLEQLGLLAGGVAHDFNNLLAAMLGHAGLARLELPAGSRAAAFIDEIANGAQRAAEMTQQLLTYAGRGRVLIGPLDLAAIVEEMTQLLRPVISNKAALRLNISSAPIEGDGTQIRQMVMNLLTNASDALQENPGEIVLETGVRHATRSDLTSPYLSDELTEGDYAFVSVSDSGVGMDEATSRKVFDPFFTTKFMGRGLGLAAVLGIVRGHKGTIRVTSEPGEGSTFLVMFPTVASARSATEAISKPAARDGATLRGHGTILVVDDDEGVRKVTTLMLEHAGFRVVSAADGQEALTVFAREAEWVSAVLLDLTMPRLDGMEVLGLLRRLRPDVRVLLMSGYSDDEVAQRFGAQPAAMFIKKPFQYDDLAARLAALLRT